MPPLEEEDTRKVQTAVSGHAHSDVPVFLPTDADDYDEFICLHPQRAFYCGTLLGGCGNRLSPKQYRDRKCHFAHVSAAERCQRAERDEASADHLYIGRALAAWLKNQGQRGIQPMYKPKMHEVREVVDVLYSGGSRLLRVQLARRSKREWEEADAELRARRSGLDWFMGPDSLLANWQVDRQGYALRIQCRSVGAGREVEVGTQFPDGSVEWTRLTECTLAPDGRVLTPRLLHAKDDTPPPPSETEQQEPPQVALPITPDSITLHDAALAGATETEHFYEVSVRVTARLTLPSWTSFLDSRWTYQPIGATLTVGDDGLWHIAADSVRPVEAEHAPDAPTEPPSTDARSHNEETVTALREALEDTARDCGMVNMATLRKRALLSEDELTIGRWLNLLLQIERPRLPGKPVLSALIKGPDGGPAPFFRDVLEHLGWERNLSDTNVLAVWNREIRRAHAAYRATTSTPAPTPQEPERRPPSRTRLSDSPALRRRAAYDVFMDLAREAQRANDFTYVEQLTVDLEALAVSTTEQQAVHEFTDWVTDQAAEKLYQDWERLAALTDQLNREGDDLHLDQLRRLLHRAEKLAQSLAPELATDERRDITRWREHVVRLAKRPTLSDICRYATTVRLALRWAARERRTTTWSELTQRIGAPLAGLHPDDKVSVLVEVDRETPEDNPPLSALITAHDTHRPHPLYRQVLFNLDRLTPAPEALYMHWRMALRRHFEGR
ncbi:competence protein CoiA family protein [Streptomyces viridosporus]|uniref:competence protein CoiA family protein n=1 Tax=Streptomyces viridosporus TaxID=67581 RepID=UPI003427BB05